MTPSDDQQLEAEIRQAMDLGTTYFAPPPADLVRQGLARGRRQARAVRLRAGAGAALAVVGVGLLYPGLARHDAPPAVATTPALTPPPTAVAPATSGPPFVRTAGAMSQQLKALVPAGSSFAKPFSEGTFSDGRITAPDPHEPAHPQASAGFVLTNSVGAGAVSLAVADIPQSPSVPHLPTCADYDRDVACSGTTLPDGTYLFRQDQAMTKGLILRMVEAYEPGGRRVSALEYNATDPVNSAVRTTMPLTADQLQVIVLSPQWKR